MQSIRRVWCVLRKNVHEMYRWGEIGEKQLERQLAAQPDDWDGWYDTKAEFDLNKLTGRTRLREVNGVTYRELEWESKREKRGWRKRFEPRYVTLFGFKIYTGTEGEVKEIPDKVTYSWIRDEKLAIKWETITEVPC